LYLRIISRCCVVKFFPTCSGVIKVFTERSCVNSFISNLLCATDHLQCCKSHTFESFLCIHSIESLLFHTGLGMLIGMILFQLQISCSLEVNNYRNDFYTQRETKLSLRMVKLSSFLFLQNQNTQNQNIFLLIIFSNLQMDSYRT
jgi:hypothetical protein